ncbi:hypothetical protein AK812_SmicGene17495 [Symbiodinium microadriaticum]|uniref:UBA domain-containing protein n=1 Tax=Symbiodinium microadriaticum TaxID=2951 RepID=A0A1Q9DXJ4_SYMMI|nr:hypothetical protein AK812_SmicGene17495 [Symbiodinium microadriaticum]
MNPPPLMNILLVLMASSLILISCIAQHLRPVAALLQERVRLIFLKQFEHFLVLTFSYKAGSDFWAGDYAGDWETPWLQEYAEISAVAALRAAWCELKAPERRYREIGEGRRELCSSETSSNRPATAVLEASRAGFSSFEMEVVEVVEDLIESLTPTSPADPLADQALDGPPEREAAAAAPEESRCKSEMEVARTDPYLDLYPWEDVVIIVSDDEEDSGAEELETAIQDSGAEELERAIQESLRGVLIPLGAFKDRVLMFAEEEPPLPSAAEPSQQEGLPTRPATAEGSQASPRRRTTPVLRLDARPKAAPSTGPMTSEESPMRTRSTSSSTSRPDPLEVDPETIWRSGGESALQTHGWRRVPSSRFPGRSEFVHESGAVRTDSGKEDRQLQTAISASLRAGAAAAAAARESPEDAELDRAIAMSLATAEQEEQHRQLAGPSSSAEADQQQSQASSSQSEWRQAPGASDELVSFLVEMGFEAEDASRELMASANDLEIVLGRLAPVRGDKVLWVVGAERPSANWLEGGKAMAATGRGCAFSCSRAREVLKDRAA